MENVFEKREYCIYIYIYIYINNFTKFLKGFMVFPLSSLISQWVPKVPNKSNFIQIGCVNMEICLQPRFHKGKNNK
jgi:hypothetical protein